MIFMTFRSSHWVRRVLVVAVAGTLLTGCGSSSDDGPSDEELRASVPVVTTADPWAVPATIDVTYAQRVIQQLSDTLGEVRRDVFDNHVYTEEDKAKIAAIHDGLLLTNRDADIARKATTPHPLIRESPSPWQVRVEQIVHANAACMYVSGKTDDSANRLDDGYAPDSTTWGLKYDPSYRSKINPTGWKLVEDAPRDLTGGDPCVG
jgi:hypothetical protein